MDQVKKQLGGLQNETKKTTSGMKSVFKKLIDGIRALGIGKKLGEAILGGIKEAMNVEAAVQQIKRIMGESSNQFLKWSDTQAAAFNMSKAEALKYGSVFGNLLMTFTKNGSETMKYTEDLLKASSIIASATGRSMEDVMERIRSGLLGNTEAIEDLGVNVNVAMIQSTEAFKKFANGKSWDQLDFQTQQQIRLMAILEQTNKKYGDSVSQNTSTQLAQLVAQLENVQLSLGQAFLPILQIVLPVLNQFASGLAYVMNIVAQFSQALFGKSIGNSQVQGTQAQAKAMTNLGNATEKAGKQAKGALAGFDEINSLNQGNDSSNTDVGNTGINSPSSNLDSSNVAITSSIPKEIQDAANKVKSIFSELKSSAVDYGAKVVNAFSGLGPALQPIIDAKEPILEAFNSIGKTAVKFKDTALKPMADYLLLDYIPSVVVGFTESFAPVFADVAVWSMQEFAKTFENVTNSSADLWNNVWMPSLDNVKNSYLENIPLIAESLQNLLDGTIKPFIDFIINSFVLPISNSFTEIIVPIFTDIAVAAFKQFTDSFNWAVNMVNDTWNNILKPVFELIKQIVLDTLEIVKNLWDKYGATLLNDISEFIKGIQDTVQLLWDNVLNPIIKPFLEMLTWLWNNHFKGLIQQLGEFILKLVNGALEIYNGVIKPIIDWVVGLLGPRISWVVNLLANVFGTLLAGIADVAQGIFRILGGIIDFIVGVFTGNWRKAWGGIVDIILGFIDTLWGVIKIPINLVIDGINALISGLNSLHIDVPNVPGITSGFTLGFNVSKIPKLAHGGITNGPTMALIGDNPGGKEVVSPLNKLQDMLISAVGTAILETTQFNSARNNNTTGDIYLQIDGATLGKVLLPHIENENQRIGKSMIIQEV